MSTGGSTLRKALRFGKDFIKRFSEHDVVGLSAQLAYFFLLSIFPFMIFLVALMGYIPIPYDFQITLTRYMPEKTLELFNENLNTKSGGLLSVGLIGTIWSASNGINAIIKAFNRAYEVEEDRSFIKTRLIAIVLTIAMIIVIIVALLLPVFGKAIGLYIFSWFGVSEEFLAVWGALRWVVSSIIILFVLISLYILAPNRHVNVKQAFLGSLFATVAWQVASFFFSFYVDISATSYSATYGSLGGVIILMIWFYLTGMIIILGGEVNAMLKERKVFVS